jgi:hypothetical protein
MPCLQTKKFNKEKKHQTAGKRSENRRTSRQNYRKTRQNSRKTASEQHAKRLEYQSSETEESHCQKTISELPPVV